jgi:hypothetical protein
VTRTGFDAVVPPRKYNPRYCAHLYCAHLFSLNQLAARTGATPYSSKLRSPSALTCAHLYDRGERALNPIFFYAALTSTRLCALTALTSWKPPVYQAALTSRSLCAHPLAPYRELPLALTRA